MMILQWYQWLSLAAFCLCLVSCLFHLVRLLGPGKPLDYSRPAGNPARAVLYSLTGAMSPAKKESARLHLPTYIAGLFYHLGTFLCLGLFFFFISGHPPGGRISTLIASLLFIAACSGLAILVKRIARKELRSLSNPDDYISNFLVTSFQFLTLVILLDSIDLLPNPHSARLAYYLIFILLALYIPIGKLRHVVYFFAARSQLGYFFGQRGVWPPKNVKNQYDG
jgi:hypothetical protein